MVNMLGVNQSNKMKDVTHYLMRNIWAGAVTLEVSYKYVKQWKKMAKFKIKKGKHYTFSLRHLLDFIFPTKQGVMEDSYFRMSFTFQLSKEAAEYYLDGPDQMDVNKICGYSLGLDHHKNSIRVGWRFNDSTGETEILAYWYDGGKRGIKVIKGFKGIHKKEIDVTIWSDKDRHTVVLPFQGLDWTEIPRVNDRKNYGIGKVLRPYFGGNKPAPHDMTVGLKIN
jgi:hypothetical protein